MATTKKNKYQIRNLTSLTTATPDGDGVSLATAKDDVNQLAGNDVFLVRGATNAISDLTVNSSTTGAFLVAVDNISGQTTVRGALGYIEPGAKCVGMAASVAALTSAFPPASHTNRVGVVWGSLTESGLYVSNGVTWDLVGATVGRTAGVWDFGGIELTNGAEPTTATSLATKAYVDGQVVGKYWREPVDYKADWVVSGTGSGQLPSVTVADNGKYGFVTGDDSGNGGLYVVTAGAWVSVSASSGEILMLNGDTSIPSGVNADYILTYDAQTGSTNWDYSGTGGTRQSPLTNEARIYKVTGNGFTYDATNTEWILTDTTGAVVGDRVYTFSWPASPANITSGETVTASIQKLSDAIGNRSSYPGYLLTNGQSVAASLAKLDLLGSPAVGEGASLIPVNDIGGYFPTSVGNLEDVTQWLAAQLAEANVRGTFLWAQKASGSSVNEGGLTFANASPTITITTGNFPAMDAFFGAPSSDLTYGTGTPADWAARRFALAAGFDIVVMVDGSDEAPIQILYTAATDTLTITMDFNLKTTSDVTVTLRRNNY